MTTGANPRRYRIQLEVSTANVAAVISTLVNEVEPPHMEPCGESLFRVTFIARQDQLSTVIGVVDNTADKIFVAPYAAPVTEALRPFASKPQSVFIPPHIPVKKIPSKKNGANAVGTVLALLKEKEIVHLPEIMDRLVAGGFAASSANPLLWRLKKDGKIVGLGAAAYKLA